MKQFALLLPFVLVPFAAFADDDDERQAAEIRRQTEELRRQTSSVRSDTERIRSQSSELSSGISQMQSQQSSAKSKISEMSSQANSMHSEESSLRMEAADFRHRAGELRSQKVGVDAKNTAARAQVTELYKVVYNLKSRADFKQGELDDLTDLLNKTDALNENMEKLIALQVKAETGAQMAEKLHSQWMKGLSDTTLRFAPKFKDILTIKDVKKSADVILGFSNEVQPQSIVLDQESIVIEQQNEISRISSAIQQDIREISRSRGLTVLNEYSGLKFPGEFWRLRDLSVYSNVDLALQMNTLMSLVQDRRNFLVRVIPVMWSRMLNVRIDSINLQSAVNAGTTSLTGLALSEIVLLVNDELDNGRKSAVHLFYEMDAPLLARDRLEKARMAARRFQVQLNAIAANPDAATVKTMVTKKQEDLENLSTLLERKYVAELDGFFQRRKLRVQKIVSTSKSIGECLKFENIVLKTNDSRENERAFITFMEKCQ